MAGDMNENRSEKPGEGERVIEMEIERLREFESHPFKVRDDQRMRELIQSIRNYGILSPLIVRPVPDGFYEIISGHRRKYAAKHLGYRKVPVIIRTMTNDQAVIAMVDSNLQRDTLMPSEKARAIRMKYDAMRRDSQRRMYSYIMTGEKGSRAVQVLGKETGDSPKQIQRYLKISELIPELLERLDRYEIAFNPAFEASFLKPEEQKMLLEAMDYVQSPPSLSQAQRIKQLSRKGELSLAFQQLTLLIFLLERTVIGPFLIVLFFLSSRIS